MQYEWREDMLSEEKQLNLQARTDQLLGKHADDVPVVCGVTPRGSDIPLPPRVTTKPRQPAGADPYARADLMTSMGQQSTAADDSRAHADPGTAMRERGAMFAIDDVSMRCVDLATTAQGSSHTALVDNVLTSHVDPVAMAQESGGGRRLTGYNDGLGPGGHTGVSLNRLLQSILQWTAPPTTRPKFAFRWTKLAAKTNWEILQRHGMDLSLALQDEPFSTLTIGSEFRPTHVLEPLLHYHPLWPNVSTWLRTGVQYPLMPIAEADRIVDLQANYERGNHKSADVNHTRLLTMLQDEVSRGWQLILPREAIHSIPNAVLAPLGLVEQDSINEFGEIIPKCRLTHDQSFNVIKGTNRSVNDRLETHELTPCRYGRALLRHVHVIVGFRYRHPTRRILQTKADLKSAYRRLHYAPRTAVQAIVQLGSFILLALRMTFGGAANPSQWSDVSELATDLSNDLVRDDGWDHVLQVSPHQHLIQDKTKFVEEDVPIAQANELAVDIPDDDAPQSDCYIDDIFSAFFEEDVDRGSRAVPFAIHLLSRPVQKYESLSRADMLSLTKFLAEATPAERETILGWMLDTRRLMIELPENKYAAWTRSINAILQQERVTHKELEELLGRLNHAGFIIPLSKHFLGRLRHAQYAAAKRRNIRLNDAQREDLLLWIQFLAKARGGISMNLLTYRKPNFIERSDACTHGIGGFSATTGIAWRWEVPVELRLRATLNLLEYVAGYITLWMDVHVGSAAPGSCFLSQTDSTSAAGWIKKSNFSDAEPMHRDVARDTARLMMDHDSCLYSSKQLENLSTAARRRLENYDLAAQLAALDAVTDGTTAKQARYWTYWETFLECIELANDPYLSDFSRSEKHRFIAAFGAAVRNNDVQTYSGVESAPPPVSATVRACFDAVAQTFRTNNLPSPIHDADGKLAFILQRELKGYTNKDASVKPQKAVTPKVVRGVTAMHRTEADVACGQLAGGAFFHAMRSCEYSKVSGERRTKLLQLEDLYFYRNNKLVSHSDPNLELSDYIVINFKFQKNNEREAKVPSHATRDHTMCPVKFWAALTKRVLSYPGTGEKTHVNTYLKQGKLCQVTSKMILDRMRAVVRTIGETNLGYKATEIGTHSLRSGAAMSMYLAGVPVYTIMLIGRWSSDAFLRYIRRQVQEFSKGISSRMILSQDFFTVPDQVHQDDPRVPGDKNNFAARSNIGLDAQRWAQKPAFSLHH